MTWPGGHRFGPGAGLHGHPSRVLSPIPGVDRGYRRRVPAGSRTLIWPVIVVLMPVAAFGQVLYPMHYDWLLSDGLSGLALQSMRITLLLIATIWGSGGYGRSAGPAGRGRRRRAGRQPA